MRLSTVSWRRGTGTWVLAFLMSTSWAQDSVEVRLLGAEGVELATALWADEQGVLLAGETTSDIVMAEGQAVWAPGGPLGKKGFIAALNPELELDWGFAFASDPNVNVGVPSALQVEDVARTQNGDVVVLYNAMVEGQWGGFLRVVGETAGSPISLEIPGSVVQSSMAPAGPGSFLIAGSSVPTSAPSTEATGIFVGVWSAEEGAPALQVLPNTEGAVAVDVTWHADTLYVAADLEGEPSAILVVTLVDGTPQVVGTAPVAWSTLGFSSIDASSQGVAWGGTLVSDDGSLDAVYGKLGGPSQDDPNLWEMDWEAVTVSDADRIARAVIWRNDLVRCTSQGVNSGAGGTGILVQERSGVTGAWFAAHTFGGVEDEDVRALAVDGQGRFLMAGFSNSWTDSPDAALFRVPAGPLNGNFEYSVSSLVLPEAAFVGHEAPNGDCWDQIPSALRSGTSWEETSLIRWSFHDLQGRQLERGNTSVVAVPFSSGWAVMALEMDCGTLRKRVLIRP